MYKLLLGKFQLDTRRKFFTMKTISCFNNIPRGVMLDTFKIQLDMVHHVIRSTTQKS